MSAHVFQQLARTPGCLTRAPYLLLPAALLLSSLVAGAQDPLARARLEIQNGQTADAIRVLEAYRQQHPNLAEVYNLLGVAYTSSGNNDQALSMYKEFARLAPNRPEAFNNLGASFLQHGDADQAENAFRRALALRPEDPDTLYNLGALLNARHNYKDARPLLGRALQHRRSPGTVFELALSEAGLGERKTALRTLNSMPPPSGAAGLPWLRLLGTLNIDAGRWVEGTKALEQALKLAPDDPVVLYSLGVARLQSNRPVEAMSLLEQSFAQLPAAERHFKVGALLAQHDADTEAITEFQRAVREDPRMYDAQFNLAVLCLRRKEVDSAAQAAERALALRKTGEVYNVLGDIREEQGRYQEALESLQQAVRLEPGSEEFVFDLGLELILHANYDAAVDLFRAAGERFPQSARIALGLGAADFMAEKNDDAIKAFVKALKLSPDYEPAYAFLGMAYLASNNPPDNVIPYLGSLARTHTQAFPAQYYYGAALAKEMDRTGKPDNAAIALESLRRASLLRPDYAPTYYYIGEVKRVQGQLDEAARSYEKALALDPNFADALYKLGRTYAKLGRQEDAVRVLARHREVSAQQNQELTRREEEIKMFVLTVRNGR